MSWIEQIYFSMGNLSLMNLVFQVSLSEHPIERIKKLSGYVKETGRKAFVNIKLSSEDPAEYMVDENIVMNRASESLMASYAYPSFRVLLIPL
jgi:hypothetical protein